MACSIHKKMRVHFSLKNILSFDRTDDDDDDDWLPTAHFSFPFLISNVIVCVCVCVLFAINYLEGNPLSTHECIESLIHVYVLIQSLIVSHSFVSILPYTFRLVRLILPKLLIILEKEAEFFFGLLSVLLLLLLLFNLVAELGLGVELN